MVPVTLKLSADELNFSFGIDNWDLHVDQVRGVCLGAGNCREQGH